LDSISAGENRIKLLKIPNPNNPCGDSRPRLSGSPGVSGRYDVKRTGRVPHFSPPLREVGSVGNPKAHRDIHPCPQPSTCAIMFEAVTVCYTANQRKLSPVFHGFWYLSSLTSGFCGEFLANSMIPEIWGEGGGGYPDSAREGSANRGRLQCPNKFIFVWKNSRFAAQRSLNFRCLLFFQSGIDRGVCADFIIVAICPSLHREIFGIDQRHAALAYHNFAENVAVDRDRAAE
jgi:hypothetical protein